MTCDKESLCQEGLPWVPHWSAQRMLEVCGVSDEWALAKLLTDFSWPGQIAGRAFLGALLASGKGRVGSAFAPCEVVRPFDPSLCTGSFQESCEGKRAWPHHPGLAALCLTRSPTFLGEGSPTKIDYRKKVPSTGGPS